MDDENKCSECNEEFTADNPCQELDTVCQKCYYTPLVADYMKQFKKSDKKIHETNFS